MDSLWLKFILFITSYTLLNFLFNKGMRKWLKEEKKKLFSYHHLNGKHKKIDWMIRITFVILIVVGGFYNASRPPLERVWFLELIFCLSSLSFCLKRLGQSWRSDTQKIGMIINSLFLS